MNGIKTATNVTGGSQMDQGFIAEGPDSPNIYWESGSYFTGQGVTIEVTYNSDGSYTTLTNFDDTSVWRQFMYGGHTTKMVPITNTYIPPADITVQKIWNDQDNAFNTRENIQLALYQSLDGGKNWSPYMQTVENEQGETELKEAVFNISKDATEEELSHLFTVPSKVDGKTATYKVVEMAWNESTQEYEKRAVKGYDDPKYSNEDGLTSGTLSVDNDLKTYDISVQKIWNDNENAYNTRKDIQLVLQRQLEGETTWSDVGTHDIASGATEDADLSKMFENLPSVVNGLNATYHVIERVTVNGQVQERVPGYSTPTYDPENISESGNLTVTNKLLKTNLNFIKYANDGTTPLSDIRFDVVGENGFTQTVITDETGKVDFTGLPVGKYTLTESNIPTGYEQVGPWNFEVVDNDGVLSVVWSDETGSPYENGEEGKVVNHLKHFDLTVNKTDDQKKALEGAEFTLVDANGKKFDVTVDGASFTFTGLIAPGTYTLTETKAPDGYRGLTEPITIEIDALGQVKVDGVAQEDVLAENGNNKITLSVANDPKAPLPSTGGPGTLLFSLIGMLALSATGLYFYFRKNQEVA
ncbi:prealbumin-like fold domain-containing protein [Enterococcus asini]|uniref:prealbumin-like fold domain-containing protein n=1 Tax=Enterococcus asini TaxID=57732 RepID=UPI001E4A9609|nr:prealbumin-like fold domain-containing protein [Enterococcus asini]MCD5030069.1 Cna B-type domain-containing protein [Enterococcus asini]